MRRTCLSFALATLAVAIALPASAATITVQGVLPLNRTLDDTPTYISTAGDGAATYTKPDNLLLDYLRSVDPRAANNDTRGINRPRDNGHSFTINAEEFAFGIHLDAIAINIEGRGNGFSPEDTSKDTFGFRVFRIESGDAFVDLVEPAEVDILASATGLALPTAADLGIAGTLNGDNPGAAGTAILSFDAPIYLEPGVYGFQFKPDWDGGKPQYTAFEWSRGGGGTNLHGIRWEEGEASANNSAGSTYAFGLVGTAAVPEPSTVALVGIAAASLALVRRRK